MRWSKSLQVGAFALVVGLLAAGAAQSRSGAADIDIGVVSDKSGPTVSTQVPWLHGLETYVKMVNDAGGIKGRKINLIEKDDRYSPTLSVDSVKSLVSNDKVPLIVGINTSSALTSILTILNQNNVVGLGGQSSPKEASNPFQPNFFGVLCNFADMADVAVGYQMALQKKTTLKGQKVGVFSLAVASGQEWADLIKERVQRLGGTFVGAQLLPTTSVSADVQVQSMMSDKPDWVAIHGSPPTAMQILNSMDKFGLRVPSVGISAVMAENVYKGTPYTANKLFKGVHCFTPAYWKGKGPELVRKTAAKYKVSSDDVNNVQFVNGWVDGQILAQGLRNANGTYTSNAIRKGLEQITNLDTGGLSPKVTYSRRCHIGIRSLRPYHWDWNKNQLVPDGTYQQWAKYVTNEYAAVGTCGRKGGLIAGVRC